MAIQRRDIADHGPEGVLWGDSPDGQWVFYNEHVEDKATALTKQREGIAEMVGQVFLDNHADDVSIVRLMRDIRDFGQEVKP